MITSRRCAATVLVLLTGFPAAFAQTTPPKDPPAHGEPHDIDDVEEALPGGVISVPLPETQRRKMRKYDVPELVGARQALGSQAVDGKLPLPLVDYVVTTDKITQRLSMFERGLVVVWMGGAGGTMRKKVILPADGFAAYRKAVSAEVLATVRPDDVTPPTGNRTSRLRVYRDDRTWVELQFDPVGMMPKRLADEVRPLEDLLRALSEDRTVTSTIAGYEPKVGDVLVGDDRKTWRVERIIEESGVVQLHGTAEPTVIYVAKKDLYNYFIGKKVTK